MPLSPGSQLGLYQITASLGAGGMGEVYRAHDPRLGRDVALKVLPAEMASDPARLERFTREARAIAALNHPHIVTIYSTEEVDGIRFLTMELVEGQPLDALIPPAGLALARFLEVLRQAMQPNPHYPGWLHFPFFTYHYNREEYRRRSGTPSRSTCHAFPSGISSWRRLPVGWSCAARRVSHWRRCGDSIQQQAATSTCGPHSHPGFGRTRSWSICWKACARRGLWPAAAAPRRRRQGWS